jgi:folate-binding Fe-S cluster repair protein YgfZ
MSLAMDPKLVPLDRAELIELSGPDAIGFAHAQFGSDVAGLEVGSWQWSAWLTAQGRVRSVFALLRVHDRLLIWLPLGGAEPFREALALFVMRAKVRIAVLEAWSLCRFDDEAGLDTASRRITELGDGYAFAQPGPQKRIAWLGPVPFERRDPALLDAWRLADIAAGLPWIDTATRDEFVPQALGLERLEAVRFD